MPKEERIWKLDGNRSKSRIGGGGGERDTMHNIGVDPHLNVQRTSAALWQKMLGISYYVINPRYNVSGNSRAHMRLCRDIYANISSDSSKIARPPLTHQ